MATVVKRIEVTASVEAAWDAIRDIGALHTRLVPGFVLDTQLEPGARLVTFGNGAILRELIVTLDEAERRLVWTAEGGLTRHYNASAQVFAKGEGALVVWTADFLPDEAKPAIDAAMTAGAAAMRAALNRA
jgi:Polyketide cyclase / dehydrase and lipid transport